MPTKILVVDDEPDLESLVRQRFRKQIHEKLYEFVFGRNGVEGLARLEANSDIQVVMTDLNMPVMDGLTFLSNISKFSRIIRVVIVSAFADMQNIRTAMNRGAFDFLAKPIDFQDFEVTLEKTIQHVKLLEAGQRAQERLAAVRQFFSPGLADALEHNPDLLEGKNQEITVLVSDLRGFSSIAERLGPEQTCRLMRDMMERLSNRIVEYDGVIVDYAGDGILAMWNAPLPQEGHALLACKAALAMLEEMPLLEASWREILGEGLEIGIGLNTGVARVGNTGSSRKFKYGPHGHTVNLASRVQSESKHLDAALLITGETRRYLPPEFPVRSLGRTQLRGIADPVELYAVGTVTADSDRAYPNFA
jgi:adenylate cyclase